MLNGTDGADLRIIASKLPFRVQNRVNMKTGRLRPSGKLAKANNKLLLQVIGEVVLRTEEDDTALRDCCKYVSAWPRQQEPVVKGTY